MRIGVLLVLFAAAASAQLVPNGQPIPRRANPPVVFLNGYQSGCTGTSDFASNFSSADKVLQTANLSTVFFDNCSVPNTPSIEVIGQAFGKFLAGLKYDDGSAVTQVDVVAHSMGGLIVRAYLSGKQEGSATFQPPATVAIRKAIFLSSPNFGSYVASILGGDTQTKEMSLGSQFLYDLNTWNQGGDDLRGVDALAIAANGGTGADSGVTGGYDDGVVAIVSSSIGFARTGRTRLVPYCHTGNFAVYLLGGCVAGTPALNNITDPTTDVSKMMLSFLAGTADWQNLGQAIEANTLGSTSATVIVAEHTPSDAPLTVMSASVGSVALSTNTQTNSGLAFKEQVPGNTTVPVTASSVGSVNATATETLTPGAGTAVLLKDGPTMLRVIPAAGMVFPYSLAPGSFIAIFGRNLATKNGQAPQPYPTQVGDVQVTVNGTAIPLQFAGGGQVNAVLPDIDPGLYAATLKNSAGQHTVNLLVEAAVPAIFTQNAGGTGDAAALNAVTGALVTPTAPLHTGDYVSLYLTGLGKATLTNGLQYSNQQPAVTIGGKPCAVTFAGRNPVFAGLDQINCQVPAGLTGMQTVLVTSGARTSNAALLYFQ